MYKQIKVDPDNVIVDLRYSSDLQPGYIEYEFDENNMIGLLGKIYDHETKSVTTSSINIRLKRDLKLSQEVDPIVSNSLRWSTMPTKDQEAWLEYRQRLLNITDQATFPHEVLWPDKPNK
tara:strand:- start:2822 stop:3181 length:360 start_codon:yes stop_codon:yes gene_type:complete